MSVTEQLMRLGQWDLALKPETPYSIRSQVDLFDHVVITASPIDTSLSDANILSMAIYTGVILEHDAFTMSGASPLWWWGTDEGVGPWPNFDYTIGAPTNHVAGMSATEWRMYTGITAGKFIEKAILTPVNGISTGTIDDTAGSASFYPNGAFGPAAGSFRELVDYMCSQDGLEYRINPNFTIDINLRTVLFVTTPTVVVTRKGAGPEGSTRGVAGPNVSKSTSGKTYTTDVVAVDSGGASSTSSSGSTMKAPDNTTASLIRRVAGDTVGQTATAASNVLNLYSTARDTITLDSSEYAITRFVEPGDTVYFWDTDAGLYDAAVQVAFRGELISPIALRLKSVTWPVEAGMGVYLRQTGATATYIDITNWVEFESGGDQVGQSVPDIANRIAQDTSTPDLQINGPATVGASAGRTAIGNDALLQPAQRGGGPNAVRDASPIPAASDPSPDLSIGGPATAVRGG